MGEHHFHGVPRWRRYLRFWRPDVAADVDEELRFHFEMRAAELRARGLAEPEVARQVAEEFGDVAATRAALREIGERRERRRARHERWSRAAADLAYAWRGLRAAPAFTLGVVLTLALSLGAASLLYGTMRRLVLVPPPHIEAPDEVRTLRFGTVGRDGVGGASAYPYLVRLRAEARTLAGVAAYGGDILAVGRGADAEEVRATLASAGFWRTLGVRPALGRFFTDDEAHPATGSRVVVLSHAFWQRRFAGDPGVLGRVLPVKGLPYEVVGVAPPGFRGVELQGADELWLPLRASHDVATGEQPRWWESAGSANLRFIVRLRPGVDHALVTRELELVAARLEREETRRKGAPYDGREARVVRLASLTGALGDDGKRIPEATVVVWLVGVAGILLVVACANVASLLLLRAMRRRREIAVRLALGMTRGRLARMFLVESALLAALGGGAAWLVVTWGGAFLERVLLAGAVSGERAGVDWALLIAVAATVSLVALGTGLAPVLQVRGDVQDGLRDGAQHGATARSRTYRALLVAQTALSTLLLVGAGLFLVSLHRVRTEDLGLEYDHAYLAMVDWSGTTRGGREIRDFAERALERARALPGVTHAALATGAPLRYAQGAAIATRPNGEPVLVDGRGASYVNHVSEGFIEATGMRMAAGRSFTAADRTGEPVMLVDETLARLAWPGRSPVGECAYRMESHATCTRVVGVVRNARTFRIRDEGDDYPRIYLPLSASAASERVLIVRVAPGMRGIEATLRRALGELDPGVPFVDVERLGDAVYPQMRPWRIGAAAFTAFGALAAIIAAVGLYTAVAYAVAQRTREIGVRLALGALRGRVVALVLGDGVRVGVAGVALGVLAALAGGRWIGPLLFETSPRDPWVLGGVAAIVVAMSLAASLVPARRASRVDPMRALRLD